MAPPDGHFGVICELIAPWLLKLRCISVRYTLLHGTDSMITPVYAKLASVVVVTVILRARIATDSAAFDDVSGSAIWALIQGLHLSNETSYRKFSPSPSQ